MHINMHFESTLCYLTHLHQSRVLLSTFCYPVSIDEKNFTENKGKLQDCASLVCIEVFGGYKEILLILKGEIYMEGKNSPGRGQDPS